MSLLYYGETWITEAHAQVCQDILRDLKIAVQYQIKSEPIEMKLKTENIKTEPPDSDDNNATEESVTVTPANEAQENVAAPEVCCNESGCSFKTSSLSSLQSHRLIHARRHQKLKTNRTCPACNFVSESPKFNREHCLEAHSETLEDQIHCIMDEKCTWSLPIFKDSLKVDFLTHLSLEHVCEDVYKMGSSDPALRCDFPGCHYVTEKGFNMTQHIRFHNDERRHVCPVCSKAFRSSSHLRDHVKAVHTKERTFQCPKCPRAFATSWQAKSHIRTNHAQKSLYMCRKCPKAFQTPQALAGHVKSSHSKKEIARECKSKICEKCGQILLKNHCCATDAGQENDPDVDCSICQKKMSSKSLRAHLQYHRKQEVSNYLCQFCNKSFTTETSLKRHILIHQNAKPHSCAVCEKSFRQKSALKTHERIHTGVRFDCSKCSRKFISKSLLTKHQNMSHK